MCGGPSREDPPSGGGGLFGGPKKPEPKPDPDGWKKPGWVKKDEGDGWTLWGDP